MTSHSEGVDELGDATSKRGTTVAMDFGRVALGEELGELDGALGLRARSDLVDVRRDLVGRRRGT